MELSIISIFFEDIAILHAKPIQKAIRKKHYDC